MAARVSPEGTLGLAGVRNHSGLILRVTPVLVFVASALGTLSSQAAAEDGCCQLKNQHCVTADAARCEKLRGTFVAGTLCDTHAGTCAEPGHPTAVVKVPTPTLTPAPICTPRRCRPGEVLICPGQCPGGCGMQCATPTPARAQKTRLPHQVATPTPTATASPTPEGVGGGCFAIPRASGPRPVRTDPGFDAAIKVTHRVDQLFVYVRAVNNTGDCLVDVKVSELQVAPTQDGIVTISAEVTAVDRSGALVVARPVADVSTGLAGAFSFTVSDAVPETRAGLIDNNGVTFKIIILITPPPTATPTPLRIDTGGLGGECEAIVVDGKVLLTLYLEITNATGGVLSNVTPFLADISTTGNARLLITSGPQPDNLRELADGQGSRFKWQGQAPSDSRGTALIRVGATATGPNGESVTTGSVECSTLVIPPRAPRAWVPSPRAYVSNQSSGTVSVIDTATNSVVATIPAGQHSVRLAITPNGKFAYVANRDSYDVSVIDTSTNMRITSIAVPDGAGPVGVAVTPDGTRAYVTNQYYRPATVSVIDTASNTITTNLSINDELHDIAITPDGQHAYIAATSAVYVVDLATNEFRTVVGIPAEIGAIELAITPNGAFAYVEGRFTTAESFVVDTATNTVVATIPAGGGNPCCNPGGVAITPNGALAYITSGSLGTVSVIDTSTNTVSPPVNVGMTPAGVAITPDGTFAYVANIGSGTVSVINTATNKVTATVPVGGEPTDIAIVSACGCESNLVS